MDPNGPTSPSSVPLVFRVRGHWLPLDREVPGVDGAGPAQRLDSMPIKPDPPGTTTPGRFSAVRFSAVPLVVPGMHRAGGPEMACLVLEIVDVRPPLL